jgi:diguanylate cyclase (GGDEF)-like protein/PAS domain S-box-containing protein
MHARIVIVDDRATNLRIYAQFVAMMGPEFSSKCFQSAVEALAWLESDTADLLIVDYRMPEMNGAEFIRRVRESGAGGGAPAIVITARQDRECRITALDAGATDFLQSPVTDTEFRERALLLINQHRKSRELEEGASGQASKNSNHQAGLPAAKSMLEQIIDTTPIMINATDRNGKLLFMNNYQSALFKEDPDSLVGKSVYDSLPAALAERERRRNSVIIETGSSIPNYEEVYVSDGVSLTFHCNKSPLQNMDRQVIGVLTSAVDITARKFAEEHRAHLALHDILTGLPNRALLSENVRTTIEECKKNGETAALLLVDLDRFKVINDTRGHQAGDLLLRSVAERISTHLNPSCFAARIGGDEFAIILRGIVDVQDAAAQCMQLLTQISQPYRIDDSEQLIGASIGVAMIPSDGTSSDELLRLADLSMYEAKANGRNRFCFFSSELNRIAQQNAEVEADLRNALDADEFVLEYQPIIDAVTTEYCGLEALLRWNHPLRGRLMPSEFIKVANDSGLINRIGLWVIDAACKQIAACRDDRIALPHVAVNVSPRQFQSPTLCDEILGFMAAHNVAPGQLTIEITEELLIDQSAELQAQLEKLRSNGVDISIDDFGTGYSSLQYLRDLPAKRLKIDQTFIARIEQSTADRAIISTIAHLAHALGMRVVAEGVETEGQRALLHAAGCDELQGFLFGRSLRIDQIYELFASGPARFQKAG